MENETGVEATESGEPEEGVEESKEKITADEILVAEFEYIAQSAFQANEDRARVSTYYVVTFGTLVAALFSLQVPTADIDKIHVALIVVFMTLAVFGFLTLLQLVRLRLAWRDCAIAMNHIKEFYISELKPMKLEKAMVWRMGSLPPAYKRSSIAFLLAFQVAILGAVSLGAGLYFFGVVTNMEDLWSELPWLVAIVGGLVYCIFQLVYYRRRLKKAGEIQIKDIAAKSGANRGS